MSRVPAAGRLLRGQLRGSAAAVPLQPRGPPARPPSVCQNRHLGVGSAGRAATGCREGQEGARMRGGTRAEADLAGRAASAPAVRRDGGVRMRRAVGRRCARSHVSQPPGLRGGPRARRRRLTPVRLLAGPLPPTAVHPLTLAPHPAPHISADFPTGSPHVCVPAGFISETPLPRSPPRQSWKNVYLCNRAPAGGRGLRGGAGAPPPGYFFFFLASLSLPSISHRACLLISAREGT